jgi:hypothetical protein
MRPLYLQAVDKRMNNMRTKSGPLEKFGLQQKMSTKLTTLFKIN